MIDHALNRRNGRMRFFAEAEDYGAFEQVIAEGLGRFLLDLLTHCRMPNHWHLETRTQTGTSIGRITGWVGVTHVRRHHQHHHISQGIDTRGGARSFPWLRTITSCPCVAT
jgi:putative transposase